MHIFYGVQGTGNGHITRARKMAKELSTAGIGVDFLFTGRAFDRYFDMDIFNHYQVKQGLTLAIKNGENKYFNTVFDSHPIEFIKDIKALDLSAYDLVITDFEPVSAWAAKVQGVPVLGIGHQYAFKYKIPKKNPDPLARVVMKFFAPADIAVGLHWHHFNQSILPPIIDRPNIITSKVENKILVYLPFENTANVMRHLLPFKDYEFHIYASETPTPLAGFMVCKAFSREGFQKDLGDCVGVICNAGFELVSEALSLGKKILVKPVHAHMEQLSNAVTLQQLGYGYVMPDLNTDIIKHWLKHGIAVKVSYPDTASFLVQWLQQGLTEMTPEVIKNVWDTVDVVHYS